MYRPTTTFLVAMMLMSGAGDDAVASEIFQWIDDDGVMHFSQWQPEDATVEVTTLQLIARNTPDYDPQDDPYSIRNQAERINSIWAELEKKRDERRERRLEAVERAARMAPVYREPARYYVPAYPFRPVRPWLPYPGHFKPGRKPQHGPGRSRPRHRPGVSPHPARSPRPAANPGPVHTTRWAPPTRSAPPRPGVPVRSWSSAGHQMRH